MFPAVFLLAAILGCTGTRPAVEQVSVAEPPEQIGPAPVAERDLADPEAPTPASLYAGCRARLEGEETAGECTTDADCSKVGCSQEMCVPAARAGDTMSTCEVLPCFRVLDACGCHEGLCSWTLKAELPGPGHLALPKK